MNYITKISTRLGAFCLILAMLLAVSSCYAPQVNEPSYLEGQHLSVEEVKVSYSAETVEKAAARATELVARAVRMKEGLVLDEPQREAIKARITMDYLPILCELCVTAEELDELLILAEQGIALAETQEGSDKEQYLMLCRLYRELIGILDADRAGLLLYEALRLYYEDRIAYYEKRYADYGYPWYLEDANAYRERHGALTEMLGKEVFVDATRVFVHAVSLASAISADVALYDDALLSGGDILLLLQRQAEVFSRIGVTEGQWGTLAELILPLMPKLGHPLQQAEREALQKNGYGARVAALMPELLTFYQTCVAALSAEQITEFCKIRDAAARTAMLCRILSEHKTELEALLARAATAIATASEAELRAIQSAKQEAEYQSFLKKTRVVTVGELIEVIEQSSLATDAAQTDALHTAFYGWLRGVAPCLAFSISAHG